jgi:hypothetical protein
LENVLRKKIQYSWQVVWVGGESLCLFGWNDCVAFYQCSHHTSGCFNTKREWSDIQK